MELILITILVAVVACCEIYRTYLGLKPRSKKEHFEHRLQATRASIWDLQFKAFKTREVREGIRQEYDYVQAQLKSLEEKIPTATPDEVGRLKDQKELAERDLKRFVLQMRELDLEVEGSRPTVEMPNGHDGVMMQIDSLRELETMLTDWISGL